MFRRILYFIVKLCNCISAECECDTMCVMLIIIVLGISQKDDSYYWRDLENVIID